MELMCRQTFLIFAFFLFCVIIWNIYRSLMKRQRKIWRVEDYAWFQFHAHCKLGATMEQIIGLRLSAEASGRWIFKLLVAYAAQQLEVHRNDITSWAVTLLISKADCSWCYTILNLSFSPCICAVHVGLARICTQVLN